MSTGSSTATWVGSIATSLAVIVALGVALTERHTRKGRDAADKQRERRAQASTISGWVDDRGLAPSMAYVLNRSDRLVYDVVLTIVMTRAGQAPPRGETLDPRYEWRKELISLQPGEWLLELPPVSHGMVTFAALEVSFTDAEGAHWVRRADGLLEEIDEPPSLYYGLGSLHGYDKPERGAS